MRKFRSATLLFLSFFIGLQVHAQVTADFVADTTQGCGSASVQFTDQSVGNITSWTWTFGNSNTSTLQNPSAAYTIVGTYDVTLTVSDGTNSDTKTITDYISVFSIPTADFTLTPTTGCSPLPVSFTNTSTQGGGIISTFLWDFSDGSQPNSTENPTHIYQTGGTFPPSLQITDANGCSDVKVFNDVIVTAAPVANFSSSTSEICSDTLTVNFNNLSTGGSLSYKWFFGDGDSSVQENPTHFYNGLGSYDLTLIASDPNCSDTLILKNYVRLAQTTVLFSTPKDFFCYNEPITFNNQSTGADLFRWEFGDGTTSTQENPTKAYQDSGFFEVKLVVSAGAICLKTYIDSIYVQKVIADFTVSPETSCNATDTVTFISNSTNGDSAFWRIQRSDALLSDSIYSSMLPDTFDYIQSITQQSFYSDTLIVYSNEGCSDLLIKNPSRIVENIETSIEFNSNTITFNDTIGGCAPVSVDFTEETIGPGQIVSWKWDLITDSISSNVANTEIPPTLVFDDDTIRMLRLTVTNNLGCTATDTQYVSSGYQLNPTFTIDPDSMCPFENNIVLETTRDSLGRQLFEEWEIEFYGLYHDSSFSASTGDSLQDPPGPGKGKILFQFPDTGSYKVRHRISYHGCDTVDSTNTVIYVNGPLPKSEAKISGQCVDRRVIQFEGNFIDVTRFVWDFGDSSALDSVNESPIHTYPELKTYFPSLILYNDSNRCGPVYDTIRLDLVPPPPLQILPEDSTFCTNESIILRPSGTSGYEQFNWIINGDTVSRDIEYPFDTVSGTYFIELYAIEELGCVSSVLDTFYISGLEANFDTTMLDNCFPIEVEFKENSISDTTIISWNWSFGNGVTSVQKVDTVSYNTQGPKSVFLKVENLFGCKDSIQKNDFINLDLLRISFLNSLSTICAGDSVTFRNVSSGLNPIYSWDFGDGTILSDTSAEFLSHTYTKGGSYTVTLSAIDETGCIRSDIKSNLITVDEVASIGFTADNLESDCYPFAVNFQDTTIGNISIWEWRFGDEASSIFENPFHNYTSVGQFDVFLKVTTPNGCSDSLEKVAYIKTRGPEAKFVFDKDTICINEEVSFNITESNNVESFFWDFGDGIGGLGNPISHTYSQNTGKIIVALIVSDSTGNCTVPLEDSIYVYEVLADFEVSDDSVCVPYEAQFTKQSIGDDSFRWNFGSGNFSTENNPTFNYSQAGKYQVSLEISSTIGCQDTAFKEIEVFPIPFAIVNSDTGICIGNSVLLVASGGVSYEWSPTTSLTSPLNDSTIANPDSTTVYQLIVANEGNCRDTTEVEVFVQQELNYDSIPDSIIIIGEKINLNAFAGLGFNYRWTPEIGLSCNDCANPIAQPLINQSYILEIFDDFDCFYLSDTIEIEVIEKYSLDVPSAFTPNGDGSNDIIYVKGWGLKQLIAFKIYNRFGELVFESTDFDIGWDGTFRGQDQNIETYIFTVEALTFSGKVLTKKGNISLLR